MTFPALSPMPPSPHVSSPPRLASPHAGRCTVALLGGLLLLLLAGSVGCGATRHPAPADRRAPIAADLRESAEARAHFDAAVQRYLGGRFPEAADAFRLLIAEFPRDVLTAEAELWLGRSLLAAGNRGDALRVFRSLTDEPRMRTSAWLYLAFAAALSEDESGLREALDALLARSARFSWDDVVLVPGDEALLASMVAEARIRRGAPVAALGDLDRVRASAQDEALLTYATERARALFELHLDPAQRRGLIDAEISLVRAVATPAAIHELVDQGHGADALTLLERNAPDLNAAGLGEQLIALQRLVMQSTEAQALRYGALLSLSGPNRPAGRAALAAILLAQRAFESEDPLSMVLIRDAAASDGVEAQVDALHRDGIVILIGPLEPDLCERARRAASARGIPYLSLRSLPWEEAREGSWRLMLDARAEAEAAVGESLRMRDSRRFAILAEAEPGPWMQAFETAARQVIADAGAEVVLLASIESGGDTLQASAEQAARLVAASDADAVIFALPAMPAASAAAWLASANVWSATDGRAGMRSGRRHVSFIGNSFLMSDVLLRNSAEYMGGALLPFWFFPELARGEAAAFGWRFAHTFGREAGQVEAFAHDATTLIRALLIGEGRTTRSAMAERLATATGVEGITGMLGFDANGNPAISPSLATVQGARFVRR